MRIPQSFCAVEHCQVHDHQLDLCSFRSVRFGETRVAEAGRVRSLVIR